MSRPTLSAILATAAVMLCVASTPAFAQRNPTDAENAAFRNKPCSDPWLSIAVASENGGVVAGSGDQDACAPKLYNNGQWNSFAQLVGYVRDARNGFASAGTRLALKDGVPALIIDNVNLAKAAGISDAAMGRVIAQGAGNIIASGAGNIVGHGSATFTTLSASEYRIKLPNGVLVIRR